MAAMTCILDDDVIQSCLGKEAPNELNIQGRNISGIDILKKSYSSWRRLDISFNSIKSLEGVEQFPRLRQLSAYCCRLDNIGCIKEMPYLTSLMIQQNEIKSIPASFKSLKYLRELRLDRNQLISIKNLSGCCCLRILDVSFNKIECLAELSGMQFLQELRANHNNIKSLETLRSLPSIRELEVSHNKLTNLDGVQHLPTLEGIHAENNYIDTLKIPQTYTKQRNPAHKLDFDSSEFNMSGGGTLSRKPSMGNVGTLSRKPSMGNVSTLSRKPSMGSVSTMSRKPSMSMLMSMNMSSIGSASERSRSSSVDFKDETVTLLGMRSLREVFLSDNLIISLDGLNTLGTKLEVLDIEKNRLELCAHKSLAFVECIGTLKRLKELKIDSKGDEKTSLELQAILIGACPMLRTIDGRILVEEAPSVQVPEDFTMAIIPQDVETNYDSNDSEDEDVTADLHEIKRKISLTSLRKVSVSGSAAALKEVGQIDDIPTMEVQFKKLLSNCKSTLAVLSIKEFSDNPIRKTPGNGVTDLRKTTSSVYGMKRTSSHSKNTENVRTRGTVTSRGRKDSNDSLKSVKSTTKREVRRIGSEPNLILPPAEIKAKQAEQK